jgi:hypothetical protein
MQQVTSQPQSNPNFRAGGNSRSTTILILALLLFALAGTLSGFATGAFTRPKHVQTVVVNKIKSSPPTVIVRTQTPNATATPEVTKLGLPVVTQYTPSETPDNTTSYTVSAYPIDQTTGKQPHVGDITCKVWLTNDDHATATLLASQDKLRSLDAVSGVLPTEIQNGLTFSSTPQIQSCNATGPTIWTYTVSSSINPGKYFLMILVDWKGNAYNWIARQINVKKVS